MKLNKLQRYTAYCIMLQMMEDGCVFMCHAMEKIGLCDWRYRLDHMQINLPELWAKKPPKNAGGSAWFNMNEDDRLKRISLINQCIKEIHP